MNHKNIETFTLVLKSNDTINIINSSSIKSYVYNINWDAVIPKSKKQNWNNVKFNLTFSFISNIQTTFGIQVNTGILSVNLGKTNSFDNTMSETSILGFISPIIYSKWSNYPTNNNVVSYHYYFAGDNDNSPTTVSYPTNSQITVLIKDTDAGVPAVNPLNYILKLHFTPIYDGIETYSIIYSNLNTANIIDRSNLNQVKFFANWEAILPQKYSKYSVSFSFRSTINAVNTYSNNTGQLSVDFGRNNNIDNKNTQSNLLGTIYQYIFGKNSGSLVYYAYHQANYTDNIPVIISKPTNNFITLTFQNINKNAITEIITMSNYYVKITLTPIKNID
jgi:hypothetical protein